MAADDRLELSTMTREAAALLLRDRIQLGSQASRERLALLPDNRAAALGIIDELLAASSCLVDNMLDLLGEDGRPQHVREVDVLQRLWDAVARVALDEELQARQGVSSPPRA